MPPPLPAESDAESIAEEIPHTKAEVKDPSPDTKMKVEEEDAEEEEEEEEGDDDEETYVVEAIVDHRPGSDFEDGEMRYFVKWKGYEKKNDRTWEIEEHLAGARLLLEAYWKSIGGRPKPDEPKPTKKRGRSSTGVKQQKPEVAKRPKTGRKSKKSNGALEQDITPTPLIGFTDAGDDDWEPPKPDDGAWDDRVQSVDTVIRENTDGELWGYLIWNDKNTDGRFYRSKAKLPVIYKACPQRMLHFYERHLVFSTAPADPGADLDADDEKNPS